jgi:hypothetical protein
MKVHVLLTLCLGASLLLISSTSANADNNGWWRSVGAVVLNATSARDDVSITFGETGCTGAGNVAQEVFIRNANSGRSVRATIEVLTYRGTQPDKSQRVEQVPPGGQVRLGCTRTVTGNTGSYEIAYRITGAEYV